MKKSLIALMALAGIAFGAETLTLASDAKNSSNAKNDSYTVAADGTASLTGGNIMRFWSLRLFRTTVIVKQISHEERDV